MAPPLANFYYGFDPLDLCYLCEDDIDLTTKPILLFTWNPNKYLCCSDSTYQYKWESMIIKALQGLSRCSKWFCIVPEISDDGRLHCHGWFELTDRIKWLKSIKPSLERFGFTKVNKMTSTNALYYYKKELDETSQIFKFVPFTHYSNKAIIKEIRSELVTKSNKTTSRIKKIGLEKFFKLPSMDVIASEDVELKSQRHLSCPTKEITYQKSDPKEFEDDIDVGRWQMLEDRQVLDMILEKN